MTEVVPGANVKEYSLALGEKAGDSVPVLTSSESIEASLEGTGARGQDVIKKTAVARAKKLSQPISFVKDLVVTVLFILKFYFR